MLIGSFQTVRCQTISPQVIATAGKSSANGGFTIDYTVGELVVKTLSVTGNMVSQGFHQTYTSTSSIEDGKDVKITIQVYPNPTYDFVNISISGENEIDFIASVFDASGRNILNMLKSESSQLQVDLSAVAPGSYFINLTNNQTHIPIKTVQIQKLSNQ
jgi:hypothetical protein